MAFSRLFIVVALFDIRLGKSRAFGWCLIISWRLVLVCEMQFIRETICLWILMWVSVDLILVYFFWCCTLMFSIYIICFPLLIQNQKLLPIIDIIKNTVPGTKYYVNMKIFSIWMRLCFLGFFFYSSRNIAIFIFISGIHNTCISNCHLWIVFTLNR